MTSQAATIPSIGSVPAAACLDDSAIRRLAMRALTVLGLAVGAWLLCAALSSTHANAAPVRIPLHAATPVRGALHDATRTVSVVTQGRVVVGHVTRTVQHVTAPVRPAVTHALPASTARTAPAAQSRVPGRSAARHATAVSPVRRSITLSAPRMAPRSQAPHIRTNRPAPQAPATPRPDTPHPAPAATGSSTGYVAHTVPASTTAVRADRRGRTLPAADRLPSCPATRPSVSPD